MLYKDFKGLKLSALGLGCMRLPTKGANSEIDAELTAEMVEYAMQQGINYYDTAWGYHGGNSEPVIGQILNKYDRSSYYIATKFPGYDLNNMDKVAEIFEKQLEKTGMEYFDFYLVHNVSEKNINHYLDPKYGIIPYLLEQKKQGRIRYLGFSAHACTAEMERFLQTYGEHMEFCQIQLNWMDWELQDAKSKVELLRRYNLPIWVMEPLRGGKLATLDDKYVQQLGQLRQESVPAWGFRYLQSIPDVVVTLSGMSNMDQLKENIEIFKTEKPVTEQECKVLYDIAREMSAAIPCTGCSYCTEYCPQGLDIPNLINLYNQETFSPGGFLVSMQVNAMDESKRPTACIGCRECEKVCPQLIKIPDVLHDLAEKTTKKK